MSRYHASSGMGAYGGAHADAVQPDAAHVRPLVAWSDAQRTSLARQYLNLWHAWSARWVPGPDATAAPDVRVQVGDPTPECASWHLTRTATAKTTSLQEGDATSAGVRVLSRHLLGDGAGGPIAHEVVRAAWDDWLESLCTWLGEPIAHLEPLPAASGDEGFDANWSGCLRLSAALFDGIWHLHLPAAAVRRLLGASDSLRQASPPTDATLDVVPALIDKTLKVRVSLEDVHLSLRQLQDLQIGDVVTLSHALDAPAHVQFADGDRVAQGWLAQHAGHVAAVLTVSPDPAALTSRPPSARSPGAHSESARPAAARPTKELQP
ncbi:MAG: FliM/FliN family flagellar motor C-terminal domain-containing protein [Bordetella sp.]|nr:FliM/FliN family flagellar motor C-terminal domain-containing protein [Bordetella sp.]